MLDRCPVNSSWTYISEDLSAGYIRYFFSDASIVDNDYNFGVFIDYPLLFAKPMIVNVGFYKINQESSDLNTELYLKDAKIKLKSDKLPETSHNIYFSDLLSASKSDNLHKYVDLLRNHNTDTETCINLLLSYEKDKMVSKGISSKVRKYIIKEELVLSNLEELVSVLSLFINECRSHSSKMKYRTDVVNSLLATIDKLPHICYNDIYGEGY